MICSGNRSYFKNDNVCKALLNNFLKQRKATEKYRKFEESFFTKMHKNVIFIVFFTHKYKFCNECQKYFPLTEIFSF